MAYDKDSIITILNYARDNGPTKAAKFFGIQYSTIRRWNNKYNVYEVQEMREFSDEKKIEILTYANQYGLISAMREYDLDVSTMRAWNKEFKIYQQTGRKKNATHQKKMERYSEEFILEVLNFVKKEGVSKAMRKYDLPDSTIRAWNKKYQVYTPRKARKFSDALKKLIVKYAHAYSVPEAVKKYDVTNDQIKDWTQKFSEKEL